MQHEPPYHSITSPGCLGAGGPAWYAVLAVSFLACSLNPVGAAGLALRMLAPHDMYTTPLGWALTATSFVIAILGFIATERIAYLQRNRRALEIASLLACGAGLLAFAIGFTLPAIIMWPISAAFVVAGTAGFRGTSGLPIPDADGVDDANPIAVRDKRDGLRGDASAERGSVVGPKPKPGRKRRRRRRGKRSSTPNRPAGAAPTD